MKRRDFFTTLVGVAAPSLLLKSSLDDVLRVSWRRRFFPGWSPPAARNSFLLERKLLLILRANLHLARAMNRDFASEFAPEAYLVGETVPIREELQADFKFARAMNRDFASQFAPEAYLVGETVLIHKPSSFSSSSLRLFS